MLAQRSDSRAFPGNPTSLLVYVFFVKNKFQSKIAEKNSRAFTEYTFTTTEGNTTTAVGLTHRLAQPLFNPRISSVMFPSSWGIPTPPLNFTLLVPLLLLRADPVGGTAMPAMPAYMSSIPVRNLRTYRKSRAYERKNDAFSVVSAIAKLYLCIKIIFYFFHSYILCQ